MDANGHDVRIEHVDGAREYFLGFEKHKSQRSAPTGQEQSLIKNEHG
jgi:hypothetical protein